MNSFSSNWNSPWLSRQVNFKNAIWTWGHFRRTICNKILFLWTRSKIVKTLFSRSCQGTNIVGPLLVFTGIWKIFFSFKHLTFVKHLEIRICINNSRSGENDLNILTLCWYIIFFYYRNIIIIGTLKWVQALGFSYWYSGSHLSNTSSPEDQHVKHVVVSFYSDFIILRRSA